MQEGLDYACQVVSEVLDKMGVAQRSSVARSVSDWRNLGRFSGRSLFYEFYES